MSRGVDGGNALAHAEHGEIEQDSAEEDEKNEAESDMEEKDDEDDGHRDTQHATGRVDREACPATFSELCEKITERANFLLEVRTGTVLVLLCLVCVISNH